MRRRNDGLCHLTVYHLDVGQVAEYVGDTSSESP